MKIENVLPTEGGKHFFEGVMLDFHFRCESLKMKIENVLPTDGGKHNFENVMYESRGRQHNFFRSDASLAIV